MKIIVNILSAFFLMVSMTSTALASNVGDTYGMSPQGMGLGNAINARVNDWSSPYYNIAGLGKTAGLDGKNNQIGFAYTYNAPDFNIDIPRTGVNGDKDLETGSFIFGGVLDAGLLFKLPSYISSTRAGVVIAMNDDQSVVQINDLDPRTHNFMRYGRECQRMTVMGGMGFGFMNDLFGFGVGVNSSFAGDGVVALENVEIDTDPQSPPGQAKMDMDMEQNLLFGLYFSPGRQWEVLEGFDLGLSYKGESVLDIYPFSTTASTDLGGIPLNLVLALNDYYFPETYTIGTAYAFGRFTVSADLEFQQWSGFEMSIPMMTNYESEFVKFDDIMIPKAGLQYRVDDSLDLLCGYYFQPSFVPDESVEGRLNFLDNDKHVVSAGFIWEIPKMSFLTCDVELIGSYQYQLLVDRDVTKPVPDDPINPAYTYGGTCHSIMLGFNMIL